LEAKEAGYLKQATLNNQALAKLQTYYKDKLSRAHDQVRLVSQKLKSELEFLKRSVASELEVQKRGQEA
jgi:hypothetical protein